jgi:hypothetical protein
LRLKVLDFYHQQLLHPGMNRMYLTMKHAYFWPKMQNEIEDYAKTCDKCQKRKRTTKQYCDKGVRERDPHN